MDRKRIVGFGLLLGIVSIVLLAAPIQALANGDMLGQLNQNGQGMQTQDCDGNALQQRTRQGLRTHDGNCTGDCVQTRCQSRQSLDQAVTTSVCNCIRHTEQHRYQNTR